MPDFTVIDGDGGKGEHSHSAATARDTLQDIIIELLRELARDQSASWKLVPLFMKFYQSAGEADCPLVKILDPAIRNARASINEEVTARRESDFDIIKHAFRLAAESMAQDGAARGRASGRHRDFEVAVEHMLLSREAKARDNGWSYLEHLSSRLGPWKPPGGSKPAGRRARKPPLVI